MGDLRAAPRITESPVNPCVTWVSPQMGPYDSALLPYVLRKPSKAAVGRRVVGSQAQLL